MTGIITSLPPLVEQPPGNNASNPAGLPGYTYTVAVLGIAQTWTALQTFPQGNISIHYQDVIGLSSSATVDTTNASNITSGTLPAARLPNPTSSTLGGVQSAAAVSHNWINSISTSGVPALSQPAFTDISGSVAAAQMPALTGEATTSAGAVAVTLTNSAVIGKVLTGYTSGAGTVSATDTILQAIQKLNGNDATNANLTGDVTSVGNATTIASNAVTNSKLATMTAFTFKANNTSGTATPTDITIDGLTLKASPAAADEIIIWDVAGTAIKKATVSAIGASAGVASINGATGAIVAYFPPQGRLTLTSATPVLTATVSGATTVYYTPYVGNMVPIYDGTNMAPTVVAEVSQLTTDATKSPAAVAASKVYDIFVWNDAGTIRATRGPAWTNSTTRGYTLTMTNGILLNTSAITNGPAALRGTWVGTIASNGSSTIDYIFGASASGGTAAVLNVWNTYNRVSTTTSVVDSGTSYTYASSTIRQARGSAGNQISFVMGTQEDGVLVSYAGTFDTGASGVSNIGVGFDSTTTFGIAPFSSQSSSNQTYAGSSAGSWSPAIGTHILTANEGQTLGTGTYNSNSITGAAKNTLMATIRN